MGCKEVDRNINIMAILDTNYWKFFIVLMKSLFENHDHPFTFYITYYDLSIEAQKEIEKYAFQHGSSCYFLYHDISCFEGFHSVSLYPVEMYFKLIAHRILPETVDRCIYLDADVIVDGSLDEVYKTAFPDSIYLYGCRDINALKRNMNGESGTYYSDFVNPGFLLMNLKALRDDHITLDSYKRHMDGRDKQKLFEEEVICATFSPNNLRHLYPFDYNYNVGADDLYRQYTRLKGIRMKKVIRHYMYHGNKKFGSFLKPWLLYFPEKVFNPDYERDLFEENIMVWWKYAKLTPLYTELALNAFPTTIKYYEEKIENMKMQQ